MIQNSFCEDQQLKNVSIINAEKQDDGGKMVCETISQVEAGGEVIACLTLQIQYSIIVVHVKA